MGDILTTFLIFVIVVVFAFFVHYKAKRRGSFGKWMWMAFFGGAAAFFVYMGFTFLVHYENPILKMFMMFFVLAVTAPIAGWLGGFIYDKRGGIK